MPCGSTRIRLNLKNRRRATRPGSGSARAARERVRRARRARRTGCVKRVSARYEEANAAFEAARAKKETQETREASAPTKRTRRSAPDLERKTASYARTAQVYALIEEKISRRGRSTRMRSRPTSGRRMALTSTPKTRGRRARHDGGRDGAPRPDHGAYHRQRRRRGRI